MLNSPIEKTMFIGLEQIMNVVNAQVPFILFRFCEIPGHFDLKIKTESIEASPESVIKILVEREIPQAYPIILMCENEVISRQTSQVLEQHNYLNIFVLASGVLAY